MASAFVPAEYHPVFRKVQFRSRAEIVESIRRRSSTSSSVISSGNSEDCDDEKDNGVFEYLEEQVDDPILETEIRLEPGKLYHDALHVDAQRLWKDIAFTAQWGAIEGSMGMSRIAASSDDGKVRDWFVTEARAIGCEIRIDALGNIFAILPGLCKDVAPIAIGSHLDTQPAGGRFDGILGVLAGLEVLRTVKESGCQTFAPLAAVCWTNEEGAGFASGCTGSSVWAGHQTLEQGQQLRSTMGHENLQSQLADIGYVGPTAAHYTANPLSCHFEIHIEQGRRLQDQNKVAGVVTGIQGIRWFRVNVYGKQGHAGSTPMADRADAFLAIAKIQVKLDELARQHGAVATVGVIEAATTPSPNTIPGAAHFTMDIRCPSETMLQKVLTGVELEMKLLETEQFDLSFQLEEVWHSPAVIFDAQMLDCLRRAVVQVTCPDKSMDMISFAGHDSAMTALRVPTAMLFVPCKDGISHAPEEWCSSHHCSISAQILLQAVLGYDLYLSQSKAQQL